MRRINALRGDTAAPPPAIARDACAFACALLVYLAAAGGLFYYAAVVQIALLCGVTAGLFSTRWERAAAAASVAVAAGWMLGPPFAGFAPLLRTDYGTMLACAAGAAVAAAATQMAGTALGGRFVRVASIVLVAFVIANYWATAHGFDARGTSVARQLAQRPGPGTMWSDEAMYAEVYNRMHEGQGYYRAVQGVWRDNHLSAGVLPASVLDVRPPALQWMLRLIAPSTSLVFYDLLILSSLAIAAAAVLAGTLVRRQFGVVAAAWVAVSVGFVPRGDTMFSETWAVALTLIALGALVYAAAHEKWRAAFLAGAVAALLAGAVREFCLILPVAGLVAAWVAPPERRRFQSITWAATAALLAVYYAAHVREASRILVAGGQGAGRWFHPGLSNVLLAVHYFDPAFGALGWSLVVVAAAGVIGAAVAPRRQVRALLGLVVSAFVIVFALFRNTPFALDDLTHTANYWGILLVPLLAACMPVAFALVPGMRRYCGEWPRSVEPELAARTAEETADE
jgi:hypothetical protein